MVSNFRRQCYFRIFFLLASLCLFTYVLVVHHLVVTSAAISLVIIFQVHALTRLVESGNKDFARFLSAIELSDFSQSFTPRIDGSAFPVLSKSLNKVVETFREVTREREEHRAYLQAVVKHVGIGLIAYTKRGEVRLFNHTLGQMLDLDGMNHLDIIGTSSPDLLDALQQIRPGESEVVRVSIHEEPMQWSLRATGLRLKGEQLTLATIQNISVELNEKEVEAWQTLIRTLTHELGNSLTPIASLAASVEPLVMNSEEDVRRALSTIRKRSEGLQRFVDSYRDLTNIPKPEFLNFAITEIFERLELLMGARLEAGSIQFTQKVTGDQILYADPKLIEQVLINLILNAIEAVSETPAPKIHMETYKDLRGRQVISVSDNGVGIVPAAREKIFIPFYTTRRGGSGIGLSLSKQIMQLHKGEIVVDDDANLVTRFYLRF